MMTRARASRQPPALLALPRELVQHIFSVRPPGRRKPPLLSVADRVRAQAVCKAWRCYLDPWQWPIEWLDMSGRDGRRAATWVSAVQPAVRAIKVAGHHSDEVLCAVLSVAPRTVLDALIVRAGARACQFLTSAVRLFPNLRDLSLCLASPCASSVLKCAVFGQLSRLESLTASGWDRVVLRGDTLLPALTQLVFSRLRHLEVVTLLPSLKELFVECVDAVQLAGECLRLPRLTLLALEEIAHELNVSWAAMPQLEELSLHGTCGLEVDTTGLPGLTHLTSLGVYYTSIESSQFSREPADSVVAAAPHTVRELALHGERLIWEQPPPLQGQSGLDRLLCHVDVITHLRDAKQLRQLIALGGSIAYLTEEHLACLSRMTSLQLLQFEYDTTDCEPTQRRLQMLRGLLPKGCEVVQPLGDQ